MIYCGDYVNPRDLEKVYEGADFVWALDLENMRNNSRWLLPCRLYEAGALGIPCLAVRDFEVGRKIESLDIGWTFDEPFEETLVEFFQTVTNADVARKRERIRALPDAAFVTSDDTLSLCRFVADDAIMTKRNRHVGRRPNARRLVLPTEERADPSAP
jgi:succinoglycan biosynthesis protein ExoL